ncbi:cutinase family protein [Nonomuraea sp. SYSU D8015]|uniref:cutinase family protein n=1 Tax=Nonomuraea sp. SYSU D8015 TaxID=2593644 RepID=UPI001660FDF8|nr:cutinase family protein [Nonomuraea sp. SYSU D8015]
MKLKSVLAAITTVIVGLTSPVALTTPAEAETCPAYWVIGVRGSGESMSGPYGMGATVGAYVSEAAELLPAAETEYLSLPYPAAPVGPDYLDSVEEGWQGLQAIIRGRAVECPAIRIGLVGYSQGAHVVNEALNWLSSQDKAALDAVRGAILIADPRSDPSSPSHFPITLSGTPATRPLDGGILTPQRLPIGDDRGIQFCIQDDPVCDSPEKGLEALGRAIAAPIHDAYRTCCTEFYFVQILGENLAQALLKRPPNMAPRFSVDAPDVSVGEGGTATNSGRIVDPEGASVTLSASVGTVTLSGDRWTWQLPNAGEGRQTVTITARDPDGAEGTVSFTLNGTNAAPVVSIDPAQVKSIDEGAELTAKANFTDASGDGPFTGRVAWGFGEPDAGDIGDGTLTGKRRYGDNGSFDVRMSVTDKDGATGSASFQVTVRNLNPVVAIDKSDTAQVNGASTFIGPRQTELSFTGRVTDAGSDDLKTSWNWGDGAELSTTSLVNPPDKDPTPSPSVEPRDVTDTKRHTWEQACLYDVRLASADDDGGSGADGAKLIVTGDARHRHLTLHWITQYRPGPRTPIDLPEKTLDCYLKIAQYTSKVFPEATDISTRDKAFTTLKALSLDPKDKLDSQLLTAWLNFANGAPGFGELVDTDFDLRPETKFSDAMTRAEAVRLDPNATTLEVLKHIKILEWINLGN